MTKTCECGVEFRTYNPRRVYCTPCSEKKQTAAQNILQEALE